VLAWAPSARVARARAATTQAPDVGFPAIDPDYLYTQFSTLVTTYQAREAGYDNAQSSPNTGHDGFATAWQAEMLRNLNGFGATARKDSFTLAGWQGRPATSPAFNIEVSVPGVAHPDQVVVIGCHYDGEASSTQSANDDGSGCAIELAVARALAQYWRAHHLYPARTLRFVIFDAEEQGLYGSFHYINSTVNGDQSSIVAMINEEQNGIEYPLRFLGKTSNPLLPTTIFVTPLSSNGLYDTGSFTSAQVQSITTFRRMEQGAAPAVFAAFRALGYTSLDYRDDHNAIVSQPIFTPADLSHAPQADDSIGSSDQMPFSLRGIPTATYIGNYSYYDRNPPPWSYPYDQPQDTIQLMNIFASGSEAPSQALKLALALPGMLTTWTLAQPQVLGSTAAPAGPVAAIGDIATTAPGQQVALTAEGGYDSTHAGAALSYHWNFGDGATASGNSVSHSWAAAGDYPLTLTVNDSAGKRVISKTVHVTATAPNAANPYTQFPQNGVPPANPAVTLPTANSGGGSVTQPVAPKPGASTGLPAWVWIALVALVLALGALLLWIGVLRRKPALGAVGEVGTGASAEEIASRKRREQALQDLLRPPGSQEH
jgi:hypothetical protein